MHCILKNTSLRCTSFSNKMYGWNISQYVQSESFLLPLVRHHSIKMNTIPFKDAIPLAGSVQPIAEEYNQFLFNTAYNPLYPFERGSNCAEHAINRSNMCLHFLHFHKGTVHNSRQKAGLFSRCMIFQIFSKKNLFKIQHYFQEVHL